MSKFKCYVGELKTTLPSLDTIRESVCRDLHKAGEFDEQEYCILHLPEKVTDKQIERFNKVFQERLEETDEEIKKTQNKNQDKQNEEVGKLSYDFSFIWFPTEVAFSEKVFKAETSFRSAVFTKSADFISAVFEKDVFFNFATFIDVGYFNSTIFKEEADFRSSIFEKDAHFKATIFGNRATFSSIKFANETYFNGAIFSQNANFNWSTFDENVHFDYSVFSKKTDFTLVTFNNNVNFESVKFLQTTYFISAIFIKKTGFDQAEFYNKISFKGATFEEKAQTSFESTKFCNAVDFAKTVFAGYFSFKGVREDQVFIGENKVLAIKGQLEKWLNYVRVVLEQHQITLEPNSTNNGDYQAILNLQDARLEQPEKISFHTVSLFPNWFVNTDPRKFNFIDCRWTNYKGTQQDIQNEISNLKQREISNPHKLLTIACRQLGENAESNRNYEDASHFRKMALEVAKFGRVEERKEFFSKLKEIGEKGITLSELLPQFVKTVKEVPTLLKTFPSGIIQFLYRWTSFYGESWGWAFFMLCMLLFTSTILYRLPNSIFDGGYLMGNIESFFYSLRIMTLQRPTPYPESIFAKGVVAIQTVLSPLQLALLALAIRRKFMR